MVKLNKFNLTHGHKTTCDMGYLVPVDYVECLPGDWFKLQNEFLVRFMPTIAPVMHVFRITLHWWYVPFRLLMSDWEPFITGGEEGTDSTVLPYVTAPSGGFAIGSLADHFGMPTGVAGLKVSAFPFRAYALIYNEWYRNQALQSKVALSLASGSDATTNTTLLKRCWQRDYFTDALPAPQKGPAVTIPMGVSAPVVGDGSRLGLLKGLSAGSETGTVGHLSQGNNQELYFSQASNSTAAIGVTTDSAKSGLLADLSEASAATINQLRQAFAIQKFQELSMRGGSRYVEYVYNMYKVRTPDASLQRPQYVGGMSSQMVISEVLQTSQTTSGDNASAQGTMAGHGVGAGASPVHTYRSLENGCLMCLMSIMPQTGYFQGLPRQYNRQTRFDFGLPLLQHLGEQGIKNSEIYTQGPSTVDSDGNVVDDKIFGYTPRYEEYRSIPSSVTGDMRTSLAFWHDDRKFASLPALNSEFVESSPDTRIFAQETLADHLVVQIVHHMKALRPLSKYGAPGLIDH